MSLGSLFQGYPGLDGAKGETGALGSKVGFCSMRVSTVFQLINVCLCMSLCVDGDEQSVKDTA